MGSDSQEYAQICMLEAEIERLTVDNSELDDHNHAQAVNIGALLTENKRLTADCEMKDKRIDWTVADNVKKAMEIERLTAIETALRAVRANQKMYEPIDSVDGWADVEQALSATDTEDK